MTNIKKEQKIKIATANLFLDTRLKKRNGLCPLKLTIYYKGIKKRYATGYDITEAQWKKINGDRLKDESLIELRDKLFTIEKKATALINDMRDLADFDFTIFENRFFNTSNIDNILDSYNEKIQKLETLGKISTSNLYNDSKNSITDFYNSIHKKPTETIEEKAIYFNSVTQVFLQSYEDWMLSKNRSVNTISMYLRCVRSLFNDYFVLKPEKINIYPFGEKKYEIPQKANVKKALVKPDVLKIMQYEAPEDTTELKAKDFWVFSYLCNGINIADIARLKYKNIDENTLFYDRQKTKGKKKGDATSIKVHLRPEAKQIIARWGNKIQKAESYIFSILTEGMTPKQELATIKQLTKTINKYIKRIATSLGIEKNVTTYTARHTFATVLKRSGVSTEFISESLGHSDLKVTENYLDSFESEELAKNSDYLV